MRIFLLRQHWQCAFLTQLKKALGTREHMRREVGDSGHSCASGDSLSLWGADSGPGHALHWFLFKLTGKGTKKRYF